MTLTTLGAAHFAAALAALVLGLVVLVDQKGTLTHRMIGLGYAVAMIILNFTALGLYRLTGSFGPFHVLALISGATIIAGVGAAWRRKPDWLARHYIYMASSYVGLLAAASAEATTRLPFFRAIITTGPQRVAFGVAIAIAFAIGAGLVLPRLKARALAYRR